jgi:CheY-like chemotaxis protein
LKVDYDYQKVCFQIEDTGIGIASTEIPQIFLPFEQVGSLNYKAQGTGLGLFITKKLVEMMGGELHVKSILGQGSSFRVELQLPKISDMEPPRQTEGQSIIGFQGLPRKILVVDDQSENRSVLKELLTPLGFEIREVRAI